jgi:hypothetical protein
MKNKISFILVIISYNANCQDIIKFKSGFIADSIPSVYNIEYFSENNKKWKNTFDESDINIICPSGAIECTYSDKGCIGFPEKIHVLSFKLNSNVIAFTYLYSLDLFEKKIILAIYDFNNKRIVSSIEVYKNICERLYSESEIDANTNTIVNKHYHLNMGHEIYYVESKYSVSVTGEISLVSRNEKGIDDARIRDILRNKTCFPFKPKDHTKFIKQ